MKELAALAKSLKDRPVAVFGLARSGLSSIRALQKAGIKTVAWDDDENARASAKESGAHIEELNGESLKGCAFLLLAPGVPLKFPEPHPVVKAAHAAGIEVICDIELFHRTGHGRRTVGITGTNGKSTTTALIHHILKSAGKKSVMGGNIGVPVFDLEMPGEDGIFVFELSSYQLDLCPAYRPDVSVLLNITPDHIDRHGTLENYAASKERIFEGPGVSVIGVDDEPSRNIFKETKEKSQRKVVSVSVTEEDTNLLKKNMVLKGDHNYQNALAAFKACEALGLSGNQILAGLRTFPGLAHRQFPVRTIGHVTYINDSKATNADAASKALVSYNNIYLIAGGRPKAGGLNGLESLMSRVKQSFLIGEAMDDFAAWMQKNNVPNHKCRTLDVAVRQAHIAAQKDPSSSVVLLSPACASWDQFSSYEERGDVFVRLVNNLEESAAA